jgi:hypothetical protein
MMMTHDNLVMTFVMTNWLLKLTIQNEQNRKLSALLMQGQN